MDQVIQMIKERTGIDENQARTAAQTVVGFLKDKLPAPVAGQIDKALSGQGKGGDAASAMDTAKGMFGDGGGR